MRNQKLYILKDNVKNPSWELRNRELFVKKSDKEGVKEMQYVPGAESIWKLENKDQGKPRSVWFIDGSLAVNADDKILIQFLEKHPDFNKEYFLYDPEAKAANELKDLENIEDAREMLRKYKDDEDKMSATAASLFGPDSLNWDPSTTKLRCFRYAETKPSELIDALKDPAAESNYIAALGLRKKVVEINAQKTAVVWSDQDRGVICHVPTGKKPLTVLGEFLFKEDNITTLQEIGNLIDIADGKKPKKVIKPKPTGNGGE